MPRIIVVDDSKFASLLSKSNWDVVTLPDTLAPERTTVRGLAAWAARQVDDASLVFINVDLACKDVRRYEQSGVEVFKFLRLADGFDGEPNRARTTHCVLYSFRDLDLLIRQKPSSTILCSEGVTFRQLPFDPRALPLDTLVGKKAQPQALKPFVRGSLTLPDERHSWANWYSAWQMLQVYEQETSDREVSADTFLLPTSNADVRDALFAYGKPTGVRRALAGRGNELEKKREQIRQATAAKPIALIDDEARRIEGKTQYGWQRVFSHLIRGKHDGVVDILGKMGVDIGTLDEEHPALVELNEEENDLSAYACILLDLRLRRDERGPVIHAQDLSGAKVLGQIRRKWPMLPIIVTTASNKVRTYEKLMALGADAYWIKQGADEQRTGEDLVEDYERLLDLVAKATGEKYQFAHRLGQALLRLYKPSVQVWWDSAAWFEGQTPAQWTGRRTAIESIIRDLLFMLRQHLHRYEMGYGYKGAKDAARMGYQDAQGERLSMLSVIQHAGKVIEAIHGLDAVEDVHKRNRSTIGGSWISERGWVVLDGQHGDWFGYYLMGVRNKASHYGNHDEIDWPALERFLTHLTCYLTLGPPEEFSPPGFSSGQRGYSMANDRIEENAGFIVGGVNRDYADLSRWLVSGDL
ncbi:MAG: response regulator [Bacteroidota bacterium]